MTAGQFVDLMKALRAVAEIVSSRAAMEVLKVQIDLVVKIGHELMACGRHRRALG